MAFSRRNLSILLTNNPKVSVTMYTFNDLIAYFKDNRPVYEALIQVRTDTTSHREGFNQPQKDLFSVLVASFTWTLTLQGGKFWDMVSDYLLKWEEATKPVNIEA